MNIEKIVQLALMIAVAPPRTQGDHWRTYVPWSLILELRKELGPAYENAVAHLDRIRAEASKQTPRG